MAVLNTASSIAPVQIFNQRWPNECPKAVAWDLQFNAALPGGADQFDLDMQLMIDRQSIEGIQACYYDNISNNSRVQLEALGTGFRTQFVARGFGQRTLILPESPQMKFTCSGGTGIFRIIMTNTPLMPYDQIGA